MKINTLKNTTIARAARVLFTVTGLTLLAAAGALLMMKPSPVERNAVSPVAMKSPVPARTASLPVRDSANDSTRTKQLAPPAKKTKFRSTALVHEDDSMPEMIHLVNLILAHQGTSDAFVMDAAGSVQLTIPNDNDVAALGSVHERWDAEVGSSPDRNFDAAFWEFKEKLQALATPAFTIRTAGKDYNYFAVPFLPSEAASLERLRFFINYSQHTYVPPTECTPEFMAALGLPWESGTICCYVDPNWSGKDSNALVSPQTFGGLAGFNWASSTATPYVITSDPDACFDASGASTVTFTAYRAAGVETFMKVGDTAGFRIEYNGQDKGMWKAIVVAATSTGSRATFLLVNRL